MSETLEEQVERLKADLARAYETNQKLHRRLQADEGPAFKAAAKNKAARSYAEVNYKLQLRQTQILQATMQAIVSACDLNGQLPRHRPRDAIIGAMAVQAIAQTAQVHVSHLGKSLPLIASVAPCGPTPTQEPTP